MSSQASRAQCAAHDERMAHALGILHPTRELELWLRAKERRAQVDEYDVRFVLDMLRELRRHGEWLKGETE